MESDDDVPLILTWDEANSGLLSEEAERGDESKCHNLILTHRAAMSAGNTGTDKQEKIPFPPPKKMFQIGRAHVWMFPSLVWRQNNLEDMMCKYVSLQKFKGALCSFGKRNSETQKGIIPNTDVVIILQNMFGPTQKWINKLFSEENTVWS